MTSYLRSPNIWKRLLNALSLIPCPQQTSPSPTRACVIYTLSCLLEIAPDLTLMVEAHNQCAYQIGDTVGFSIPSTRLEQALIDHAEHPVIIAMHHPPFNTLIGHMDQIGLLEGAPELEQLLRRFNNIERVICGHLHRPISSRKLMQLFSFNVSFKTKPTLCPNPYRQVFAAIICGLLFSFLQVLYEHNAPSFLR